MGVCILQTYPETNVQPQIFSRRFLFQDREVYHISWLLIEDPFHYINIKKPPPDQIAREGMGGELVNARLEKLIYIVCFFAMRGYIKTFSFLVFTNPNADE